MKKLFILVFCTVIFGCSKSENSYIGYFSYENSLNKKERLIHIKEENGKFYFSENILKKIEYDELPIINGQFQISGSPLKISDDGNSIFISNAFGSIQANRVSNEYANKKISALKEQKKQCTEIQERFKSESSAIKSKEWNNFVDRFKATVPKGCYVKGLNKRW